MEKKSKTIEEQFVDLKKENLSLKHQVGGYTIQTEKQKKIISDLREKLSEKDKALLDADKKQDAIQALYDDVCVKYSDANNNFVVCKANLDYILSLPWYKRLFSWGKVVKAYGTKKK